ncbi:CapA family protein [Alkalihalobacillus sp. MEB130]|uniref:CapA family protein n=1 Tax=Alkalihalobacillus sp. MEB130 TaxID=2976704 RepID=UPI0028DEDC70|nr:CapA family protein [Alkalihalobacillus sp. MEB130]MDT8860405.1 CapA family protein [Alkalihalobacillus sp. MEB130]
MKIRVFSMVMILMIFSACSQQQEEVTTELSETEIDAEIVRQEAPPEPEVKETTITIGAIGDILLHERVYVPAETEEGTHDFMPMLEDVGPLLGEPDFLMANFESIPGGVEIGLSTYPSFNSPHEIVTDMQSLGVDMAIAANNHTIDRGVRAVESALNFFDEVGMDYVGAYRDTEDRETDRIVDVEGIRIGVLAYTYGTNGIPIPEGHEDIVALIDPERMTTDVKQLRDKVDIVVVHMHWGDEYIHEPNTEQQELAQLLSEAGTDIIIGHHPHVLQPIDLLEQEDGYETYVFYSLGNFFSGQNFEYTDIGGLATIEVTKLTEGDESTFEIHSPDIEPTLVELINDVYSVRPMADTEGSLINGVTAEETRKHIWKYLHEQN